MVAMTPAVADLRAQTSAHPSRGSPSVRSFFRNDRISHQTMSGPPDQQQGKQCRAIHGSAPPRSAGNVSVAGCRMTQPRGRLEEA